MLRVLCLVCICLIALPAICEPAAKYQVGTITEVKPHHPTGDESSDVIRFDIAVRVGDTIYLTLYTPALGMNTAKYAAGRDVVVLVGKTAITSNDLLGQPIELPIVSQHPVDKAKRSK